MFVYIDLSKSKQIYASLIKIANKKKENSHTFLRESFSYHCKSYAFQPRAEAPKTAASASFIPENNIFTLFLNIGIRLFSIACFIGTRSKSPDFANPPNRTIASGLLNFTKSANALPSTSVFAKNPLLCAPRPSQRYRSRDILCFRIRRFCHCVQL